MNARWAAAALGAALTLSTAGPGQAADLYDSPPSRHGSAYDDPRYADIYRHPPSRKDHYEERYERRDRHDDDDRYDRYDRKGYLRPFDRGPRHAGRHYGCVPRHAIRERLSGDGWHDFHDLELSGGIAYVKARRPGGRQFDLKVDRCTGDIVDARPVSSSYGPYAYGRRGRYAY